MERYKTKSAVFLLALHDQKVLLQKRMNTGFMDGYYDMAASGHIEEGETITQAMIRETYEECGLRLDPNRLSLFTTIHKWSRPEDVYYYFYFVVNLTREEVDQVRNGEPEKIEGFAWFDLDKLPNLLIDHNQLAIQNYLSGNLLSEMGFDRLLLGD